MKSQGWISIHRKIREHWIWEDPHKLKRWLDILLEVNHTTAKVNIGNQIIECQRGQSIRSLKGWADRWGVSKESARHFLQLLQRDKMIILESLTKTTRITVCNYDTYQNDAHEKLTQSRHKAFSNNNDDKNINNLSAGFDLWWKEYPKKIGRKAAELAWQKTTDKPPVEVMISILLRQRGQAQWQIENGKFIPNPAKYLNEARWQDEIESTTANKSKFTN